MRILVLTRSTPEHPQKGGMEAHAAQLIAGLAARGHTVEALTTAHPAGHASLPCGGATVHYLTGTPPGVYSDAWWRASRAWVAREHARAPFDVLLAESGAADAVLEHRHEVPGLPLVAVIHGVTRWTLEGMWRNLGHTTRLHQVAAMAWTFAAEWVRARRPRALYERLICVSEPLVHACLRDSLYPPQRVVCVANGVDVAGIQAALPRRDAVRDELGVPADAVLVLVSGRLEPDKGVHHALAAAEQVPVHLVIAGDGSARAALEARRVERARFTGHVDAARLAELHAASDVYLFPTLLSESFGYGVAEAMAAGRPVVAPMAGGIPMMLAPEETGLAIAPGDVRGIADALRRLSKDAGLRARLGAEGRRRAERFTQARMLDGFERVLAEVAARR